MPEHSESFAVMDCLRNGTDELFDFIYAVAVVHMLVPDEDRNGFWPVDVYCCDREKRGRGLPAGTSPLPFPKKISKKAETGVDKSVYS